jgi:peptide/nickel transport system substrate-binding protein
MKTLDRRGISKAVYVVIVVIIVILIGATILLGTNHSSAITTSSQTSVVASPTSQTTTATSGQPLAANQTLVVDYTSSPGSLDPASDVEIAGFGIMGNIMQSLVYYNNSDSSTIVPVLAQNYSIGSDGRTITFTLRQGITFSNGDPFNAYCVWYSYYRAAVMRQSGAFFYGVELNLSGVTAAELNELNSSTNTPPQSLMPVLGNTTNAIAVLGPYKVQIRTNSPFPDIFGWMVYSKIVDPRAIEMHGGVVAGQSNSWANLNPIGTGPFILQTWVQGSYAILVRNPNYWGGPGQGVFPTPKLSKVVIYFVPSETTREENILSGSADVAAIDTPRISAVNRSQGVVLPDFGISNTYAWMPIDGRQYPLNITQVREAVVHAINWTQIDQQVYHGLLYPSAGVVPYGLVGFNASMHPYAYQPVLAENLLSQAGFPNGTGMPTLTFYYATDYPETYLVAQVVQADLAGIGIQVQLKGLTFSQILGLDSSTPDSSPQHPSLQWVSITGSPIPSGYADPLFMTNNYGNLDNYSNPVVDQLLTEAQGTFNNTLRAELYNQASQIVYNSYFYYFIGNIRDFFPAQFFVFRSNVHGYYYQSAFSQLDFSTIYLT